MSDEATTGMSEEDRMAAEWAAALSEAKPSSNETASELSHPLESVAAASFTNFQASPPGSIGAGNDLNMILDIPVQLTVELGRRTGLRGGCTITGIAVAVERRHFDIQRTVVGGAAFADQLVDPRPERAAYTARHYGTSNGRNAIKIDRLLTGADAGWLGANHE